ncbi:MAG: IS110 family transposase [Gemmatimonadaceae bacterium]|nr:IS110 family transposase [Gemmatimonadaceae bacterium]
MRIAVGIDIAKDAHWVTALDETGGVRLDRALPNTPGALAALCEELAALGPSTERRVGVDVLGGIATLTVAVLLAAGETVVYVSGLSVNRAREGQIGGEHKSDPRDARVIADQVRTRRALRPVTAEEASAVELRLLVGRRRDLVSEQTRRLARLHELLLTIHPGLERRLDLTTASALHLLVRYVTPREVRGAGVARVTRYLRQHTTDARARALAAAACAAAAEQSLAVPGEAMAARFVRELAQEALAARERLHALDAELTAAVAAHPDGALITSLPGMGAVLAGEFLVEAGQGGDLRARFGTPDALASAAGLAPVLRQSGRVRFLRRSTRGNRVLKRALYQSAFCSLRDPASRTFYDRKRREGKRHHQAVLALARRRVNVLWAMLTHRTPYQPPTPREAPVIAA